MTVRGPKCEKEYRVAAETACRERQTKYRRYSSHRHL
jgi:hypothetical protein